MSKTRIGIYLSDDIIELCDNNLERFDLNSRGELFTLALKKLVAPDVVDVFDDIVSPALEKTIQGTIKVTEDHLSALMFRLAVEIDMMLNIVAATNEFDDADIRGLRKMCVNNVKALRGRISFDDAIALQRED